MKTPLGEYFLNCARDTFRCARGHLPHDYLILGKIYADQLWDWDTFWLSKGLLRLLGGFPEDKQPEIVRHIEGSFKNFLANQGENGKIPLLVGADTRDIFDCVSDPTHERNQAKPVLAQFALEICKAKKDFRWISPYFVSLLEFLDSWETYYLSPCGLLVWGGDTAIGVDNDPTTYGRPEFSSANLLLNCLYYKDLQAAAEIALGLGEHDRASQLKKQADSLAASIQMECWDREDGFFYTVDVQCRDMRDKFIPKEIPRGMDMNWKSLPLKVKMFTGFLPMWCGISTVEQAEILVEKHLANEREFDSPWGIPSLARNGKMYAPEEETSNPSNWLGPVWIIANYFVWEGLRNYGFADEANRLADKTARLLERDLELTGTLHECYHPDTGKPNYNGDFLSWNILGAVMQAEERMAE